MKLLLDTHAALWFLSGDERLSENARRHLTDGSNRVLLSAAVVWEISIKRSLGKLTVPDEYLRVLLDAGVQPLPVSVEHAEAVRQLPPHHRDPFDRMLVGQARIEGGALVSRDDALAPYGVTLVW
ncbi:MAG TPA: type II toxin-antitoxin system VapC family toxin [Baekduia sp.]|uniref:type II toxin-antitoxin system VapC family toxin n=1 Tax=Baekduia sp. TaxID=2600305 RepID=UPI002D79E12B|nr:type II toxin-antitoxin system VapC family toxin [Baekduia sp.]HET6507268.1 type II toxin-antitoxin system VapC family toxin [Baekduia sp.]